MNFDFLDEELIKFSKTLNKDIWLGYKLKSKVKNKLLEIAKSFISYLDFDIQIDDILFVGSMANFNFNEDSDIDLHITTNFKKYNFDEDMLINFFNTKKTLYNQNHNITIYKHPVELYIEDSNNPAKSNGKYSLLKNKWLQIPQKINKQIQDVIDNPKYIEFVNKIEVVLSSDFNNDEANDLLNDIYEVRKQGLSEDGEYSEGNLIFKKLRSKGYLKKLKDYINDNNDKSLSLTESMNDDMIAIAKKYFGTTTNINEAGYILPSGELLDLSGKKYNIKNKGQRRLDHREISSAYNETSYDIDLLKFMDEGCIRWIPEFQQLTITIKPTKKQMAVISQLFKRFGEISVEICRGSHNWGSDKNSMYNDYTKFSMFNKDIETFYGRNEIISENKNEDISFYDSVVDAYEGELSKLLIMNVHGKDVGYIEYSVYDEEPFVQYIFVEETYRRKGYGSKLVRKLQSLYPNSEINFGMTTEDGTKLYNSLEKIITPNPLYTKKQQELKRIKQWMKKFNAIADKDAEDWTEKEIQYLRKYSDIWQKYHNRVQDIEKWLEDNKKQTVRIKVDESNNFLSKNVKFVTSPSQLLSILKSQNGGYRILYDKNLDMYMIGHEEEVIHQDMLEYAYKSGLYYNMEGFIESLGSFQNYIETGVSGGWDANDNEIEPYLFYMIFDPYNEWKIGDDEYDSLYKLKFGNLLTRNCDIKDIPLYNLLVSKKEINESLYHAEMLKNGQMFEIYKNPTYNEFWDLMKYSKEKVLRGICGVGHDTNLYVWDAYYGGMHSDILDKYIKSDDTINTHSFVQIYFRPNRDIEVYGLSLALNNIIEKYYGKEEDSHKSLQSIFDDDDLGLLNETQEPKLNDNFWKWFGNSKVVDENGNPLVVYHGTRSKFNEFDRKYAKRGFFFTTEKRKNLVAGYYAYYNDDEGSILPCYIKLENPLIVHRPYGKEDHIARKNGTLSNYDGIIAIYDDKDDWEFSDYDYIEKKRKPLTIKNGEVIEYIVFDPNNIKSVNNNGNWSLEVDNINEGKSFFTDSGIIDAKFAWEYDFKNGQPTTVEAYHMTPYKFTSFQIGQVNAWGKGVYLTTDPTQCSFNPKTIMDWYKMRLYATFYKPFVYENYISEESINWFINEIKQVLSENDLTKTNINEIQLSSEKTLLDTYLNIIFKNFARTRYQKQSSLQVVNNIQHYDELYNLNVYDKLGLDGMILPFYKAFDGNQDKDMEKTVWYICYKTNQIKSYDTNNGNFDITKNDINESVQNNEYIAYHGSPNKFKAFDNKMLGSSTFIYEPDIESAKLGHFFTTDKGYADFYGSNVYKCKITLNNPLIYDMSEYISTDEKIVKIINQAKENGNDGVILKNIREYERPNPSTEYIVFNSNQIEILDVNSKKSLVSNNINESYNYIGNIEYMINPSSRELRTFANETKYKEIRATLDIKSGNLYCWNAENVTHSRFNDMLDVGGLLLRINRIGKCISDKPDGMFRKSEVDYLKQNNNIQKAGLKFSTQYIE